MTFSLHAAIVPVFEQTLGTVASLLDKAESHCAERGLEAAAILDARLAEDMLPFAYQVKSTTVHSIGAIEGARRGLFSPDRTPAPGTFDALRAQVAETRAALAALAAGEIDGLVGRDTRFEMGEFKIDFTAENFLTSFSLPNFYFHATTAYAILRSAGLAIGKRDFLGKLRTTEPGSA